MKHCILLLAMLLPFLGFSQSETGAVKGTITTPNGESAEKITGQLKGAGK